MHVRALNISTLCAHTTGPSRSRVRARCQADKPASKEELNGPEEINEDTLAKLRAFEEENRKLKEKLAGSVCAFFLGLVWCCCARALAAPHSLDARALLAEA
jgi:hypothetical protein